MGEGVAHADPAQTVDDEGVFIDVAVVVEGDEIAPHDERVRADHGHRER